MKHKFILLEELFPAKKEKRKDEMSRLRSTVVQRLYGEEQRQESYEPNYATHGQSYNDQCSQDCTEKIKIRNDIILTPRSNK